MKAWILSNKKDDNPYFSLVFADTISEAKEQANCSSILLYQTDLEIENWIDISAKRAKEFDDMEEKSEKEICLKLMKEYGCWFEIDSNYYTEDDIDDFKKLLEKRCRNEQNGKKKK